MRKTLILDSTQIDKFLTCPLSWEYESVNLLSLLEPKRDSMDMGSFGHKLLEHYYRGIAGNMSPEESYKRANLIYGEIALLEDIGLTEKRKRDVLLKFQWYYFKYGLKSNDIIPLVQNDKPMIELGFSYPLLDTSEYLFVLEGMIDLIGLMDGMKVFMDHKFQERKRSLYKKSIQFKNYALVTNSFLGCINYVRVTDKLDDTTFERSMITFNPQFLRSWKQELIELFITIHKSSQSDKRQQNWSSCSGKFGYPCIFTPLCEEYNPQIKNAILETKYTKIEKWEPWKLSEQLVGE